MEAQTTPEAAATLAIDLGGTRIKAGIVLGNSVKQQRIAPTEDEQGFARVLQNMVALGEELLREWPAEAIGLSLPAIVDTARGTVIDIRKNLLGLIDYPLGEWLRDRFQLPVAMENDARLYGLGELVAGAGRNVENMVCLTLGTGVGCCVVRNGRILCGRQGTAGILGGHLTIETYGPQCTCGNIGCVEALCSAAGLVNEVSERLSMAPGHAFHTSTKLTPEIIFAAAAAGDSLACAARAAYVRHLSAAVVSYIHVYDPDLILLGGGMMHAADQILPSVQSFVQEHAWTVPPGRVPVHAAALGDQAALVGAAVLARGEAVFC